jgi:hypothetical protein
MVPVTRELAFLTGFALTFWAFTALAAISVAHGNRAAVLALIGCGAPALATTVLVARLRREGRAR